MGDGSDSLLCDRFIRAFEKDAVRKFAPQSAGLLNVFKKFYLGFDEANFEVHLCGVMKAPKEDESFEVMFTDVLYTPYMDDSSLLSTVCDLFGLDEGDALVRLKKAELVAKDFKLAS